MIFAKSIINKKNRDFIGGSVTKTEFSKQGA